MRRFGIDIGTGRGRTAALLIGLALLLRLLVPAGWMPASTAQGGWAIAPCPGSGATMPGMTPSAMRIMHHGPASQDHGAGDHSCPFSNLAMALDEPAPIVLALPRLAIGAWTAGAPIAVAVGRGLAAPPPPSTGPPSA